MDRLEGYGIDPELEGDRAARPTVSLRPAGGGAPIVVAFTTFPGLMVRAGHWYTLGFPGCGCDACDETAETEAQGLEQLVGTLVSGHFRESMRNVRGGDAWQEQETRAPSDRAPMQGARDLPPGSRVSPEIAQARVAAAGGNEFDWKPWRRRGESATGGTE